MIRRVKIQGYKSLRNVELELEPLTVLFGPNSAGKSNFLDALQLLSGLATCRTLKDAFAPPYRGKPLESFAFGPGGVAELLKKETATFSIEADIELSQQVIEDVEQQIRLMREGDGPERSEKGNGQPRPVAFIREKFLRYRIEIEILPSSGILRVSDERVAALTGKLVEKRARNPFLECVGAKRFHLRMEGQSHPTYYERWLDKTILSQPHYAPHHPHMVALQKELSNCHYFYFEPRERMREANPVKEVRHIGSMGQDLAAFLNTLKKLDAGQFAALEKALRMVIPSISGLDVRVSNLGEVELGVMEGDMPIPARLLSEGTLRVLGLLALNGAKQTPTVIGFEEPENGIHPRRIQAIARLLETRAAGGKTQLIVTTHSPILPNYLPDRSLFVCRKENGATSITPFNCWGPLAKDSAVAIALDDSTPVSERIMRGDFDAP